MRFFRKRQKTSIIIEYHTLQSQGGKIYLFNRITNFERLEIIGNRLVVFVSDNGFTKTGRIGAQYNLDDYNVSFSD